MILTRLFTVTAFTRPLFNEHIRKKTKLEAFRGGHVHDVGQNYNSIDDEDIDSDGEQVIDKYEVADADDGHLSMLVKRPVICL